MKVGFHVGQVVPSGTLDLQQQWQMHLEQFRAARDAGFDIFSWGHHYLIHPFQHFQPLPVLARLAAEPGDIKLATGVLLLPLLNPVDVAEQIATLDHISHGRVILGVGLGYRIEEFEAFGVALAERRARMDEGLALIKRLWTEERVTHHGRFYRVTDVRPTMKPFTKPHPPIWQAAMTNRAVTSVARSGDILYIGPANSYATVRRQVELYHETLARYGHPQPGDMVLVREFYVAESRSQALAKAAPGFRKKYEVYAMHGLQENDPVLRAKVAGGDLEALIEDTFIVGSPEECVEQIGRYRELGFTTVNIRLFYPGMSQREVLEHIEAVGIKVLPALKKL